METKKLIVAVLIASLVGGYIGGLVGGNQSGPLSVGGDSNLDSLILDNEGQTNNDTILTTTRGTAVFGTTTVASSPDGFVAWDDVTTVATGTAKAVFTNTGNPMMCGDESGAIFFDSTGFSPSLVVSMGTSSTATGYSAGLLASTTVATTTDAVVDLTYAAPFRLANGESIVLSLSDITNTAASSTFYSNWGIQFGVQCWTLGQ